MVIEEEKKEVGVIPGPPPPPLPDPIKVSFETKTMVFLLFPPKIFSPIFIIKHFLYYSRVKFDPS